MNKSWITFFVLLFITPILISFTITDLQKTPNDKFIVVLDAGHGGHDPGNIGNGYLEKDIALNVVLEAGKELEKDPSIKVLYTRNDDTFVDLFKRGEIANQANADLFVSVHCNSHNSDANGAETFVLGLHANQRNFEVAKKENSVIYLEDDYAQRYAEYDINSPESIIGLTIMQEEFLDQSILLGKKLQDNFTKRLKRKDRKVKQAGFIVLHQTFMPSVLVETGFLTNKSEGGYLNSKNGQREMGKAIADAILAYKSEINTGVNTSTVSTEIEDAEVAVNIPEETKSEGTPPDKAEETPKKEETIVSSTPKEETTPPVVPSNTGVVFKVQLLASAKSIPLKGENFNGLGELSREPYKNLYRYMYGNANTLDDAKKLKANADAKGYTTSYIVAYKDGKRVPLSQATN
ncbi:MAG: N-acetylmuramoyl-L-alanine amidase [Allomuricauda sp.]